MKLADISKERITDILKDKNIETVTISQFIEVLEHSDMARYSQITNTEMEAEFERAKQVIVQLDKQL